MKTEVGIIRLFGMHSCRYSRTVLHGRYQLLFTKLLQKLFSVFLPCFLQRRGTHSIGPLKTLKRASSWNNVAGNKGLSVFRGCRIRQSRLLVRLYMIYGTTLGIQRRLFSKLPSPIHKRAFFGSFLRACRTPRSPSTSSEPPRIASYGDVRWYWGHFSYTP